jgi:hypothetical protein
MSSARAVEWFSPLLVFREKFSHDRRPVRPCTSYLLLMQLDELNNQNYDLAVIKLVVGGVNTANCLYFRKLWR